MKGLKYDQGKPEWYLMPFKVLEEVVYVLMHGAHKYGPEDWKITVSRPATKKQMSGKNRYFSAIFRHLREYQGGTMLDKETRRHHLAHVICCCLFIIWKDLFWKNNH